MKNVFFDFSFVSGLGKWNVDKAAQVAKGMRQLGLQRLLYGFRQPGSAQSSSDTYKRWPQIPLTEEEFRAIENSSARYFPKTPGPQPRRLE